MTNRREFVQTGLALPALSLTAGAVFPPRTDAGEPATLTLERFVYDVRFAESYDIGRHAQSRGIPASPIADDLMDLWYEDLDLRWKQAPMAVAGVTMADALFVLETFALDRGMRVVYRGEHGAVAHGRIRHALTGPVGLLEPLRGLTADAEWEPALADAMARCPLGKPEIGALSFETSAPGASLRDVPLHSWIIAPRSAVAVTVGS